MGCMTVNFLEFTQPAKILKPKDSKHNAKMTSDLQVNQYRNKKC